MSELSHTHTADVTLANWPDELLEKYGNLTLPSLYDFILSQEKIAAEVRKQNKELQSCHQALKRIDEHLVDLSQQADDCQALLDEEIKEKELRNDEETDDCAAEPSSSVSSPSYDADASQVLMQGMDSLLTLLDATRRSNQEILSIVPQSSGLFIKSKPAWRAQLEKILHGHSLGIETIRDKTLACLADMKIQVIHPELGSPFQPQRHRAVESLSGGPSQCIAKVIRCGYSRDGEIIRYADVSVYQ